MDERSLTNLYSRLIEINQESFVGEEFDVAFHALSGALHCAENIKDSKYLKEVERLAKEQLKWVDTHNPEYQHSTQSAHVRGHISIFQHLANMANARVTMIQMAERRRS
jgi:hypothetical protein